MEEKSSGLKLPPGYTNLGFDEEAATSAPTAPQIEDGAFGGEPTPGPSGLPPKYEEIGPRKEPTTDQRAPTAPTPGFVCPPGTLQCTPPSLLFEDIYEACIHYVEDNCCYSSRFARQMKLASIDNQCAFHYTLESFGEKRESAWTHIPYKGGPVDGPSNGPPPDPWDMNVSPLVMFVSTYTTRTIPHTETVETCYSCSGSGKVTCSRCGGSGRESCWRCSGSGRNDGETCSSCSGSGDERCSKCSGDGKVTCSTCDGYGNIMNYKKLIVTWTNHLTDFVSNIHKLPAKKFKEVTGDTLFTETALKVLPLVHAPDASVNAASARLLESHHNSFTSELIIRQRHYLRAIPFTVVKYTWKEVAGEFYIFGKEKAVYFEDYPTNCCCICC